MFVFVCNLALVGATTVTPKTSTSMSQLKAPQLKAPSTCQVCEAVVMAAHLYAEFEMLNASALDKQLSNVCAYVPMSYQPQCAVMVSAFGMSECVCITTATATFNATACCADVALCDGDDVVAKVGAQPSECDVCESAVSTANVIMQYESWNSTVCQSKLGLVCAFVPMQYQMECTTLIQTFGKLECDCITDPKFNAQLCCSDVGVCPMPPLAAPLPTTGVAAMPSECDVCESAVSTANVIMQYESWNSTMCQNKIGLVCPFVPMQYQMECQTLVQTFGKLECDCITDRKFNAQACCADVGVCPQPPLAAPVLAKQEPAPGQYCSACKVVATAAHYIAAIAGLNGTVLDSDLQAVCVYVPVEYQAECQDVIAIAGQEVADCVTNSTMFDAQTCCADADLCTSASKLAQHLRSRL